MSVKILSASSFHVAEMARRDFERATGVPIQEADERSLQIWIASMGERLKTNTIRAYIVRLRSVFNLLESFELPKREKVQSPILSQEQIRAMFSEIGKKNDREL